MTWALFSFDFCRNDVSSQTYTCSIVGSNELLRTVSDVYNYREDYLMQNNNILAIQLIMSFELFFIVTRTKVFLQVSTKA